MTPRSAPAARAWLLALAGALALLFWVTYSGVQRADFVAAQQLEPQRLDPASPSGRAGGTHEYVLPERNVESAHWILQTEQMLARREWRVRQIDYENAPHGRVSRTPSPYRWWLGLVAWGEHVLTGRPLALAVERAALYADPLLHFVLVLGVTWFAWRQFGGVSAAVGAVVLVTMFPLGATFQPGAPDDRTLALVCAVWSILGLCSGLRLDGAADPAAAGRARWHFLAAGIAGGLGCWVRISMQVPVIVGVLAGLLASAAMTRRADGTHASNGIANAPWWVWIGSGALTTLVAFLVEYLPAHAATWELRVNHPLYALAWVGGGAVAVTVARWLEHPSARWSGRDTLLIAGGTLAFASLPVTMIVRGDPGFFSGGLAAYSALRFADDTVATNLWTWISRDGVSRSTLATLLPAVLALMAGWWCWRRRRAPAALVFLLGPVLVTLVFACWRLEGWSRFDAMLLPLVLVANTVGKETAPAVFPRGAWMAMLVAIASIGAVRILQPTLQGAGRPVGEAEFDGLLQRDLAHWLARRSAGQEPVMLAPPGEALALAYYGGLPGLGSLDWENADGLRAIGRILQSSSVEEGEALFDGRAITHVILPSWDVYLDSLAGVKEGAGEGSFLDSLRTFALPGWLRPVAYAVPEPAQRAGRTLIVLERVEEQSEALQLSRLADYFVETGDLDSAAKVAVSLRRFPADLGAWVARAQVERARGENGPLATSMSTIASMVTSRADGGLAPDRRAALAVVLYLGDQKELAREQVQRWFASANEENLRALTNVSLYRLLVLAREFGLRIADERLHTFALGLLSADSRARLTGAASR